MRTVIANRGALSIAATAALLAGCGGSQQLIGGPGRLPQTPSTIGQTDRANYKILYRFRGGGSDAANPRAGLIDVSGKLYGTTFGGGPDYFGCTAYLSCGTIFSVTLGGKEKVLHTFSTRGDGHNPAAGLVDAGGMLYGTTTSGGFGECVGYYFICGTVFSITPSGAEKVLYNFGDPHGSNPYAALIRVRDTLYGTTTQGGQYGCTNSSSCPFNGTVFSITTSGKEKVVHSFGYGTDGGYPLAGLVDVGGKLYGTTYFGGAFGNGTVFRVTRGGAEIDTLPHYITFHYAGAKQFFKVPHGVRLLGVVALGAAGASRSGASVGLGGRVHAAVPVTPGETLVVFVGGTGSGTAGGFNGGGSGGSSFAERSASQFRTWSGWKGATGNGLVVFSWQ